MTRSKRMKEHYASLISYINTSSRIANIDSNEGVIIHNKRYLLCIATLRGEGKHLKTKFRDRQ